MFWLFDTPWAMRKMLAWVSRRYGRPEVWVTENGVPLRDEAGLSVFDALKDAARIDFYRWGGALGVEVWV